MQGILWDKFHMRKKAPLRLRMETLKVKGVPLIVHSAVERINAHNIAASMGIEIATRSRLDAAGFEIHRVK